MKGRATAAARNAVAMAAAAAAVSRNMSAVQRASPGRRARRRRYRQRKREAFRNVGNLHFGPSSAGIARSAVGRSEVVPSENFEPMEPQVVGGEMGRISLPMLNEMGRTRQGQMWALKHLHPNGETVTSSAGIPDHTSVPVVTPEHRSNYVIEGLGGDANYNYDIIFPGTQDLAFMWRRYQAGQQPKWDSWNAVYYAAADLSGEDFQFFSAPSSGSAGGTKFTAAVVGGNSGTSYPRARGMYAGMTITFDAPALYDQGRGVFAQVPVTKEVRQLVVEIKPTEGSSDPLVLANAIDLGNLPFTEDELFQASPGAVVHQAREGCYLPLRFNEPVHQYGTVQPTSGTKGPPPLLCYNNSEVSPGGGVDYWTRTFRGEVGSSGKVANFGTEGFFNFLTGIALFRGISGKANLSVKTRVGVEAQVERGSSISPFQHASPPLDLTALDVVTIVAQSSPQAYPACYNDLGEILNVIKKVLSGGKVVANTLGGMGVPGAGLIGNILGTLGFSGRRFGGPARAGRRRVQLSNYY